AGPGRTIEEAGILLLPPAFFTDAGLLSGHTATIDWGDGSPAGPGIVAELGGSGTIGASHAYRESGTFLVSVGLTDTAGHGGTATFTVGVRNRPANVAAGADRSAREGETVAVTAAFADPGTLDTHTATIDWGDGTVESGVVSEASGSGIVTGSHAYRDD